FLCTSSFSTDIYTLSLHDALPISSGLIGTAVAISTMPAGIGIGTILLIGAGTAAGAAILGGVLAYGLSYALAYFGHKLDKGAERSEEHTSELQSLRHLVCRLLLEK